MANATPITIDTNGTQAPFNWPSIAVGANENITAQLGRKCFKEFGVPSTSDALSANCQLRIRLCINHGQFTIASTAANQGYYLKESVVSSVSTCPIMIASSFPGAPLDGRLSASTEFNVAYGAVANAFTNKTIEGDFKTAHGVPQYASPMGSVSRTLQPGSAIRNFQCMISGDTCFNNSKEYDFSSFKDEVAELAAINGDLDNRLNCGLLNEAQWSYANCMLVADVSRMTHKDVPASVVVSGIVGSSQGSNILVIVVYERELEHDVLTGGVYRAE
ncbi:hypothetical protein PybrP1_011687 [[Pythium] brassicae (nom. inval.)]|nr:hypothetical protein PybrP1_011687 [[Pythium] brassicae (nom. inval.)]